MDFAAARQNMVDCQILPNRVTDQRLISALSTVPREAFVPTEFKGVAYVDEAIPLGGGRYLMEPLVTARLVQAAEPKAQDLALVIGCGTGYGAAVLSYLAGTVVAVESDGGLAKEANQILSGLGMDTVAVIEGHLERDTGSKPPMTLSSSMAPSPMSPRPFSRSWPKEADWSPSFPKTASARPCS